MGVKKGVQKERGLRRGDVLLVRLDPTEGSEIRKTRPCLLISPDEMNRVLKTYVVAPMTTGGKRWPTRIPCTFRQTSGHVVLDQIRTIDSDRVVRRLGAIHHATLKSVLAGLVEMFSE